MGNKSPTTVSLINVYYCPNLVFTLLSVTCMAHSRFKALMEGNSCKIYSPSYQLIGQIPKIRGLYCITPIHSANIATKVLTISQLHRLMGHINHDDL